MVCVCVCVCVSLNVSKNVTYLSGGRMQITAVWLSTVTGRLPYKAEGLWSQCVCVCESSHSFISIILPLESTFVLTSPFLGKADNTEYRLSAELLITPAGVLKPLPHPRSLSADPQRLASRSCQCLPSCVQHTQTLRLSGEFHPHAFIRGRNMSGWWWNGASTTGCVISVWVCVYCPGSTSEKPRPTVMSDTEEVVEEYEE